MAESDHAPQLYIGLVVVAAGVTPAWLLAAYQVANPIERHHFWNWTRLPAFIPLVLAVMVAIALVRGWRLPGMPKPKQSRDDRGKTRKQKPVSAPTVSGSAALTQGSPSSPAFSFKLLPTLQEQLQRGRSLVVRCDQAGIFNLNQVRRIEIDAWVAGTEQLLKDRPFDLLAFVEPTAPSIIFSPGPATDCAYLREKVNRLAKIVEG